MADGKASCNERRKAMATMLNAVSVAILAGSGLPAVLGSPVDAGYMLLGMSLFAIMQIALQALLKTIED